MTNHKKSFKSHFRLFQWNCRSLSTNLMYLKHHLVENEYDILILQSLNVTSDNLPNLPYFYYPPIHEVTDFKEKIQSAIYIHEGLDYNPGEYNVSTNNTDIHTCTTSVKLDKLILNIISLYLPRGPNEKNTEWLRTIEEKQNGKWFIGGDFNAHAPFWEKDCKLVTNNRLVENIVDSNLYLLNDGSITRIPDISSQRATAIDLSLISPDLVLSASWETIKDTLGSDHLPIVVSLKKESFNNDIEEDIIPKYNYKKADWNKFQNFLDIQDFDKNNNDNIDDMFKFFKDTVLRAADLAIPRKKGTLSSSTREIYGGMKLVKRQLTIKKKNINYTSKTKQKKIILK